MNTRFVVGLGLGLLFGLVGDFVTAQSKSRGAGSRSQKAKTLTPEDLFPKKRILDVQITLRDEDWDTIRRQSRNFFSALQSRRKYEPVDGPYTYVTASVTIDGVTYPEVGLRKKGFIGSQSSSRPSLKIKLNYVDKQGQIGDMTHLTLNNGKQDVTGLSQYMGYGLFTAAGLPACRCAFAKVTVNGKELGIYEHVESIRKPMIKYNFGNDTGILYEGTVVDFFKGWEGSFERKFGDKVRGREHIDKLTKALQGGEGNVILGADARGRAWVPTDGRQDRKWTAFRFDDSKWIAGRNGAGYETGKGYEDLISQAWDFREQMRGKAASVYLRLPFEVKSRAELASGGKLLLRVKYDDGFVAYLNGTQVASANAPEKPRWDSKATEPNDDGAAREFESFDISKYRSKIRQGENVLAIHGMNSVMSSTDMLIVAEIQTNDHDYEKAIGELVDLDSFYEFWALEGLVGFWDGYAANRNNYFMYLNPVSGKFHFLPWGADCMFEKYSRLKVDRRAPISVKTQGMIAYRLYQIESCRNRYAKTIKRLMDKHWNERDLLAEAKRVNNMLAPHRYPSVQSRARGAYNNITKFIRSRRREVLEEIKGGMPIWTAYPDAPPIIGGDKGPPRKSGEEAAAGKAGDSIWDAAKEGDLESIERHLRKGMDVNARSEQGDSPLVMAALGGQDEAVKFLVAKGANVNNRNNENATPMHGAAFFGRIGVVKLLVQYQAKVNARNHKGETPLDHGGAAWSGELAGLVDFFGGILNISIDHQAVKLGRTRVAQYLRSNGGKHGAALGPAKAEGIWASAKAGDLEALEQHVAGGANLNRRDNMGITPMSWAAMAGQQAAVVWLLDNGAKVAAKNKDGVTPLYSAAIFAHAEIVELLLKEEVEINALDEDGKTALDSVSSAWNQETEGIYKYLDGLLKLKLDFKALRQERPKVAKILRKNGAKLGKQLK